MLPWLSEVVHTLEKVVHSGHPSSGWGKTFVFVVGPPSSLVVTIIIPELVTVVPSSSAVHVVVSSLHSGQSWSVGAGKIDVDVVKTPSSLVVTITTPDSVIEDPFSSVGQVDVNSVHSGHIRSV